jgi:hypothetical protein
MGLVKGLDFDNRQGGSVIRQGSESFVAEITGTRPNDTNGLTPTIKGPFQNQRSALLTGSKILKHKSQTTGCARIQCRSNCPRGDGMMPVARWRGVLTVWLINPTGWLAKNSGTFSKHDSVSVCPFALNSRLVGKPEIPRQLPDSTWAISAFIGT